jgi:sensor histidine kinase YesM
MKRGFRFWLVYALAWLPYAASYVVVFTQQGGSISSAVYDALSNVIPAAALGVGVLGLCRRLPWSHYRRPWFFPLHVGLAVLYAVLWVSSVSFIFTIWTSIQRAELTIVFLQSYALQWEFFSGLMIYATLASLAYVLQISASLREEERRNKEIELRAARAEALQTQTELSALRAKLNPHFLFNTLHTLMALMREDRAQAEAAIERFNSMLRYILRRQTNGENGDGVSSQTTFKDEWQFVQDYLSLEQLRLGDRLTVETKIDPRSFDALLPPLSLQPLIENAIKHGVAPRASGGRISIKASINESNLIVTVSDDGRGATRDEVEESSGLGLRLIDKTLRTQYAGLAQFSIETSPHAGFTVRPQIPQDIEEPDLIGEALAV